MEAEEVMSHPAGPGPTWLETLLNRMPGERLSNASGAALEEGMSSDGDKEGCFGSGGVVGYFSRYKTEFKEIALVGYGGGGEVWKAINRLDRRDYAVKKIALDPEDRDLNRKIRREVTTISRLLHGHVVRYYAAWVEETEDTGLIVSDRDASRDVSSSTYESTSPTSGRVLPGAHLNLTLSGGISFDHTNTSFSMNKPSEPSSSTDIAIKRGAPDTHRGCRLLYIQMEYCYATLQQAIQGGNLWRNQAEVARLFVQLLDAVQYVHSMRVIHRDLKVGVDLIYCEYHPHVLVVLFCLYLIYVASECFLGLLGQYKNW